MYSRLHDKGLYFSLLTPERRIGHLCSANVIFGIFHLDGDVSAFSDSFLTNFHCSEQFCLKKLFSKFFPPGQGMMSIFRILASESFCALHSFRMKSRIN